MAFKPGLDDDLGPVSDINVIPLIDVMLVLLIVFMITAPLMTQGLTVELPTAEGRNLETTSSNPTKITVERSGEVAVDGNPVGSGAELETNLTSMLRSRKVSRAILEADTNVSYGDVIHVIDIMNRAGVEQLGMLTRPPESSSAGRRR